MGPVRGVSLSGVVLRGVSKRYGDHPAAVSGVDVAVAAGELFVLVGPSGAGKSTLLRVIAGLESPSAGEVWIGGRRVDALPPRERDVAMVFQNPALFPHLSVFENLAFGLRARGARRAEVDARVRQTASALRLGHLLDRRPQTLSGGERQRVALGRVMARRPAVALLDEPFSSLDAPLRVALRAELTRLHAELGVTMVHVTHDQAEALALGQRVAVMDRGRVAQVGSPREVYERPANRFVAQFLGSPPMNVLPCAVERTGESCRVTVVDGPPEASWSWDGGLPCGGGAARVDLGLRPEHVVVAGPAPCALPAEVLRLEPRGHETIAELAVGPHRVFARLPAHPGIAVGDRPPVGFRAADCAAFDPATGVALR
jgi:ABC-type sugar transport system ATPase subunit